MSMFVAGVAALVMLLSKVTESALANSSAACVTTFDQLKEEKSHSPLLPPLFQTNTDGLPLTITPICFGLVAVMFVKVNV